MATATVTATAIVSTTLFLTILLFVSTTSFASDFGGGAAGGSRSIGGRYSFSLTTFDPTGKLSQVEHATRAASLGPPVVAVCLSGGRGVVMASLFSVPTPLVKDDGTARFCRITDRIAVAHSGVSADGRVVVSAAQRMAVEHAYTFDEDVPIETFLEELSSLFQRYTMKAGSRPFGCSLLVAHVPADGEDNCGDYDDSEADASCRVYRIDPSGTVESMGVISCIGREDGDKIAKALDARQCAEANSCEEAEEILVDVLREQLQPSTTKASSGNNKALPKLSFLAASLTRRKGLVVRKAR